MTRPMTSRAEYIRFRDEMGKWSGTTFIKKEAAVEMLGGGILLTAIGITQSVDDFLKNSATTILNQAYIPEEWELEAEAAGDYLRLVKAVGHEIEHRLQANPSALAPRNSLEIFVDAAQRAVLEQSWAAIVAKIPLAHAELRTSGFDFMRRYIFKKIGKYSRGVYEAHAYAVGAEIEYAMTGKVASLEHLEANISHGYGLEADAIADAKLILESRLSELNMTGILRSTIAQHAVTVLKGIDPELVIAGV